MGRRLWIGLGVATVLWLSLLPLRAAPTAKWGMPPVGLGSQSDLCHRGEITVHPAAPTTADPVSIVVSGWWGSSCPAVTYEHRRAGYHITLSITVTDVAVTPPIGCLDVVTAWSITHELGMLLPGDYAVQADCSAGACWSFQAKTTFQVRAPTEVRWQQYLPAVVRDGTGS